MINSKTFRILALVIAPILLGIIIWTIAGFRTDSPSTDPTGQIVVETEAATTPSISIPVIDTPDATDPEPTNKSDHLVDDGTGLTPVEPDMTEPDTSETAPTGTAEPEPVQPETPVALPAVDEDDSKHDGIVIGGGKIEYDCGTEGHHCDGPETHAYILNLELKGCKYCGSHSCPSFYAVDEWGNTCYAPSHCPEYDIHKDPVYYCQKCGKACGDGSGDTCVQFINACACPNCAEYVDSWTCHTCK